MRSPHFEGVYAATVSKDPISRITDKVLGEILKDRLEKTGGLPSVPVQKEAEVEEEEEEDTEAMMDQMRNRLEALRS